MIPSDDGNVIPDLRVTNNLVVRLMQEFYGQNRAVITDGFYTTANLTQYLLDSHDVTNHSEFPREIIKQKDEITKGQSDMLYNGNQVAAIVWQDKKPIYFVISKYIGAPVQQVLRYDAHKGRQLPIICPKAVKAYNTYGEGVWTIMIMCHLQKC